MKLYPTNVRPLFSEGDRVEVVRRGEINFIGSVGHIDSLEPTGGDGWEYFIPGVGLLPETYLMLVPPTRIYAGQEFEMGQKVRVVGGFENKNLIGKIATITNVLITTDFGFLYYLNNNRKDNYKSKWLEPLDTEEQPEYIETKEQLWAILERYKRTLQTADGTRTGMFLEELEKELPAKRQSKFYKEAAKRVCAIDIKKDIGSWSRPNFLSIFDYFDLLDEFFDDERKKKEIELMQIKAKALILRLKLLKLQLQL